MLNRLERPGIACHTYFRSERVRERGGMVNPDHTFYEGAIGNMMQTQGMYYTRNVNLQSNEPFIK